MVQELAWRKASAARRREALAGVAHVTIPWPISFASAEVGAAIPDLLTINDLSVEFRTMAGRSRR
jgi:hypothetical protein